jgi:broad specificity phosphatase PhoE
MTRGKHRLLSSDQGDEELKIYMMRHGEALDDVENCYGGIADFPLTDKGREQAMRAAAALPVEPPEVIYSSPLKRAKETAEIVAAQLGVKPVVVLRDLQERNTYGVLSGMNKDKARLVFDNILAALEEEPGRSNEYIPGCEEFELFVSRVRRAFDEVIADAVKRKAVTIAVVTHRRFTQVLFEDVLRLDATFDLKLSAMNVLEYEPAKIALKPA